MKWTRLADLPVPVSGAYAAVQDKKIYVAGGASPVDDIDVHQQVYVYNINTDHWGHLPPPGHYYGVPQIIGGKLAIIGGRLSTTKERTNKVSTFDKASQTWISYYPDLLSVRVRPGVVTHLEHVIVAGGVKGVQNDEPVMQDDIEVLNWVTKNSHWKRVSIKLPVPMDSFAPIIVDGQFCVVGYERVESADKVHNDAYKIPVVDITRSADQHQASSTSNKWITTTPSDHCYTALVPSLFAGTSWWA